jgi:diaminohydroxyphosphoribosylaminopyrimidine deaminase/5-amino-6-(5-phosphoribosylamino)uracil reductase
MESKPGRADMERHLRFLRLALELAEGGRGRTSPNPMVGAVVVRDGEVVGQGYHVHAGAPHAEVVALEQAGPRAGGATLYVNLEPCSHFGRTPPCVERILDSGVRSVVACIRDPDPRVDGRGFRALRQGGLEVVEGLLEAEALRLNETFAKFVRTRLPFVLVKAAASLDGKLATESGESFWITGELSRRRVHRLRFDFDAVMVGCGTVLRDDPRLTVRQPDLPPKRLTRVILDAGLHCPPTAAVLRTLDQGPVAIYCTAAAPPEARERLQAAGARVRVVKEDGGRVSLLAVLSDLGERNLTSVLLEGGGTLIGSAVRAGLVDKFCLFLAPVLIGGDRAPGLVRGPGLGALADCPRLDGIRLTRVGADLVLEGYPGNSGRPAPGETKLDPPARE